jgi:hypothetical protein
VGSKEEETQRLLKPSLNDVRTYQIGKFLDYSLSVSGGKKSKTLFGLKSVVHPKWFEQRHTTQQMDLYCRQKRFISSLLSQQFPGDGGGNANGGKRRTTVTKKESGITNTILLKDPHGRQAVNALQGKKAKLVESLAAMRTEFAVMSGEYFHPTKAFCQNFWKIHYTIQRSENLSRSSRYASQISRLRLKKLLFAKSGRNSFTTEKNLSMVG